MGHRAVAWRACPKGASDVEGCSELGRCALCAVAARSRVSLFQGPTDHLFCHIVFE